MKFELSEADYEKIEFGCTKGSKEDHVGRITIHDGHIKVICKQCGTNILFKQIQGEEFKIGNATYTREEKSDEYYKSKKASKKLRGFPHLT
jgi:hypothetical protein